MIRVPLRNRMEIISLEYFQSGESLLTRLDLRSLVVNKILMCLCYGCSQNFEIV